MKEYSERNQKEKNKRAVQILAVMVLAAGVLMYCAWRGYEEKLEILYAVLEQQREGTDPVDLVTGLLKGQRAAEASEAGQRLAQYGFHDDYANRYKKSLYVSWGVIIAVFGLMTAGLLLLLNRADNRREQIRKKELLWLQELVAALRGCAPGHFQNRDILENYDEDMGRLLMEFAALTDSIGLLRKQAETEREGTKALVTDISHQLKTPVAALMTSFEILQSDGLGAEEYQEFLGRCRIQVARLEELVSALVNISRMETGMIELKIVERNLFDTVLLAVNRIYPKAEEKGIELGLEADEALRQVSVRHDSRWLCEAFLNVLENAVKYSAARTRIVIRMVRMTVYLRVEIEDEGIGIPRGEWNKIFQRFYRGGADEVQRETGSGVGLYLAREIVSRHEGTLVAAAPRHGKRGSCFVFQLPYEI